MNKTTCTNSHTQHTHTHMLTHRQRDRPKRRCHWISDLCRKHTFKYFRKSVDKDEWEIEIFDWLNEMSESNWIQSHLFG